MASEHAQKLREVAAQLSTERIQGWSNPLVTAIADAADFLDGSEQIDTGDAVLSRPTPVAPVSSEPFEDLLKKAVAAFNALSPEQQAEMLEEQRQSWVRGNVGLSRDERGMTTPVAPVSPDATVKCGELETVAWESMDNKCDPDDKLVYEIKFPRNGDKRLVYRSQAVELLAAITKERDHWKEYSSGQGKLIESGVFVTNDEYVRLTALEAKLAAAEKALEPFARLEIPSKPQGNAGAYSIRHKDILEARAALGGKPS